MKEIEKQLENFEDHIFDGFDSENMDIAFSKLNKFKQLADQNGSWKYRVKVRKFIVQFGYEFDYLHLSMSELAWLVGHWELNKEEESLEEAMPLLERYIEHFPCFPDIAEGHIHAAIEVLKKWFATTSLPSQQLDWALFKIYQKMGEPALAEQHLQELLKQEAIHPLRFESMNCKSCYRSQEIHYYASIGLLEKALEKAEAYLDGEVTPCLTSPRTGLSHLLAALLDAERLEDVRRWLPVIEEHIDFPVKAPLRLALPLLRYYNECGETEKADAMVASYEPLLKEMGDRWAVGRFSELMMKA